MTKKAPPRAPDDLEDAGRQLWRRVLAVFDLGPDELTLLAEAARSADELARIRTALGDAELLVPGSKGQPVAHPLLAETRAHRATLEKLLGALALPDEDEEAGHTPRSRRAQRAAQSRWGRVAELPGRRPSRGA